MAVDAQELERYGGPLLAAGHRQLPEDHREERGAEGGLRRHAHGAQGGGARTGSRGRRLDLLFEPEPAGRIRLTERGRSATSKPVVFEAVEQFKPTPAEAAAFAGTYRSDEVEPTFRIAVEEGRLVIRRLRFPPQTLEPLTRDAFRTPSFVVRFSRDAKGRVTGCQLSTGRVRGFRLAKDQG